MADKTAMTQMSLGLDAAVGKLHGSCSVNFSKGRTVRCCLMARDGSWHDGDGPSIAGAIESALANVDDAEFAEVLREIQCGEA